MEATHAPALVAVQQLLVDVRKLDGESGPQEAQPRRGQPGPVRESGNDMIKRPRRRLVVTRYCRQLPLPSSPDRDS